MTGGVVPAGQSRIAAAIVSIPAEQRSLPSKSSSTVTHYADAVGHLGNQPDDSHHPQRFTLAS